MTSPPIIKGLSRVEAAFEQSDQRRYHVPCPHCGEHQVLKWAMLRWDDGRPDTARYYCEHCGEQIEEAAKPKMLLGGKWIAGAPFNGTAGFHINELYSPWRRWSEIASDFLEAKQGGTEMLKAWVNTSLGETWEEQGDGIEEIGLMARLEDYADDLPIRVTTAGVDVQKDRLEITVVGWGAGEEAWVQDHLILAGDTARPEVWADLDEALRGWRLHAVAIDSGFNASQVYAFVARHRYCYATKGASGFARPLVEDARKRAQRLRKANKRGVAVELVGVDAGKVQVFSKLRIQSPGPGYIHFPQSRGIDEEYFAQLAAERLVVKYRFGRPSQEWVQLRPRNEALDCMVYALAAPRLSGAGLEHRVKPKTEADAGGLAPAAPARVIGGRRARYYVVKG